MSLCSCKQGLFCLAALLLQWCTANPRGDSGLRALPSNQPSNKLLMEFGSMWRRPGVANTSVSKGACFMWILQACTHFIATATRTRWCKSNGKELQNSLSTNAKNNHQIHCWTIQKAAWNHLCLLVHTCWMSLCSCKEGLFCLSAILLHWCTADWRGI